MQSDQYGRLDDIKVMKDKAIPRNSMEDGAIPWNPVAVERDRAAPNLLKSNFLGLAAKNAS